MAARVLALHQEALEDFTRGGPCTRVLNMSKTWKEEHRKHRAKSAQPKPQKAIARLVMLEANREIREALRAPQEAARA